MSTDEPGLDETQESNGSKQLEKRECRDEAWKLVSDCINARKSGKETVLELRNAGITKEMLSGKDIKRSRIRIRKFIKRMAVALAEVRDDSDSD